MARNTKPLFSTDQSDFTWTYASGTKTGELVKNDYPPTEKGQAGICISNTTTAGSDTITVKCQMYFKIGTESLWGGLKTVTDEDGNNLTFSGGTDTDSTDANVVANLYAQDWWQPNDGFRIVLTGNTGDTIGGKACAIIE